MTGPDASPLVTAVVPTYGRRPDYLRTAVESVRDQTSDEVELVVVDDSPDAVSAWLDDWSPGGLTAVRTIRDRSHDGASAARNTGIDAASGRYVAFLDDDDWWHPRKVERQVARLERDPAVGVVHTGARRVDDGESLGEVFPATGDDALHHLFTGDRLGPFSTVMVRRSVVDSAGRIDEGLAFLEDREWYVRLAQHCSFAPVSEPLVTVRKGDHDQLSDDFEHLRRVTYPRFLDRHRETAADYGPRYERALVASLSKTVTNAALANGRYDEARRFALRAVRHRPTDPEAYGYLLAALGGRTTYRVARRAHRLRNRLATRSRS